MAWHAALALAADLPVHFAHTHSVRTRHRPGTTGGLIREYLPKKTEIPGDPEYLWGHGSLG